MSNQLTWKENPGTRALDHNFVANLTHDLDSDTVAEKHLWAGLYSGQPVVHIMAQLLPDCVELGLDNSYSYVALMAPAWRKYFKGGLAGEPFFTSKPITDAARQAPAALEGVKSKTQTAMKRILATKRKSA